MNYSKKNNLKAYTAWRNMLRRCYVEAERFRNESYSNCKVSVNFQDFQFFAPWFEERYQEGYELDKDLLGDGKLYSENTSCLVPKEINMALVGGIGYRANGKGFQATLYSEGCQHILGQYGTEDEAHAAYLVAKKQNITRLAEKYRFDIEERVYRKLMAWEV